MRYYSEQFILVHHLLKDYGCFATYTNEPEYKENPILSGLCFYRTLSEEKIHLPYKIEWIEIVDARLDVCVPTKKGFSPSNTNLFDTIRFDIEWSKKAKLYSMYVSLPNAGRSVSLSKNLYKDQNSLLLEINKWLKEAGCRLSKKGTKKEKHEEKAEVMQLSLFS